MQIYRIVSEVHILKVIQLQVLYCGDFVFPHWKPMQIDFYNKWRVLAYCFAEFYPSYKIPKTIYHRYFDMDITLSIRTDYRSFSWLNLSYFQFCAKFRWIFFHFPLSQFRHHNVFVCVTIFQTFNAEALNPCYYLIKWLFYMYVVFHEESIETICLHIHAFSTYRISV